MSRQQGSAFRIMALLMLGCAVLNWSVLPDTAASRRGWPALSSFNSQLSATTRASAGEAYGRMEMSFEANEGQFAPQVKFFAHAHGYSLFLTADEAVMVLRKPGSDVSGQFGLLSGKRSVDRTRGSLASNTRFAPEQGVEEPPDERATVLRMKLVAGNRSARAEQIDELPGRSNYFIGNDPTKWRTGVRRFARVTYREVYPGVDLVYYGNQGQLEYDFVIAPGADPQLIRLSFEGAEGVTIDDAGDLIISASGAALRQHSPVVYQEVNGVKKPVAARYVMNGSNEVGFDVAGYDIGSSLVIDPVLSYSTYLGGVGEDVGNAIAVDSAGNAFITGRTASANFPTTAGGFQTDKGSFADAFVVKLNPSGSSLVYSTYIGGAGNDEGNGIAVDSVGNAYLTGRTGSDDFPTTPGAFQTGTNRGAFVTKLDSSGAALTYSTYLTGNGAVDSSSSVAVDSSGNAHVTGITTSAVFPITPGAFQSEFRGGFDNPCLFGDAFVTKLNATGTGLLYSTFLGGSLGEIGLGIALDSAGNAYVTGATGSDDFPTVQGAFQPAHGGCLAEFCQTNICEDGFVTKLNPTGTEALYSSYLGGIIGDSGRSIAVDFAGNAYVTGQTGSSDFPKVNALQSTWGGGGTDAFVSKVDTTGSALMYSTFVGGASSDSGKGIAVDSEGNANVTGFTSSPDFPVANPIRPFAGFIDLFVLKLSPTGSTLLYSTHFGGASFDGLSAAIAVDAAGAAYITGGTESNDFPTNAGAFQPAFGGDGDLFVAKFIETPPFDLCLQDDSGAGRLAINSMTGEYSMTNCRGFTMGGTGVVKRRGCLITLQVNAPDRKVLAKIDTCVRRGTATIQSVPQHLTFIIMDRNTADNTCACP